MTEVRDGQELLNKFYDEFAVSTPQAVAEGNDDRLLRPMKNGAAGEPICEVIKVQKARFNAIIRTPVVSDPQKHPINFI
jgi:hypothetical protein